MVINDRYIIGIRDEICDLLWTCHDAHLIEHLVERLAPFGVNGGFLGYVDMDTALESNQNAIEGGQPQVSEPLIIAEARGSVIGLNYTAAEYLGDVFPCDFAAVSCGYQVFKDTQIFVAKKMPGLCRAKPYRKFYLPRKLVDFFVYCFPVHDDKLVWLSLNCPRHFRPSEIAALTKLFGMFGLGHILKFAIHRGSDLDFLTKTFASRDWRFMKYLSMAHELEDKQEVAKAYGRKAKTIDGYLESLIRDHGAGRLQTLHARVFQRPLIAWFEEQVRRPRGDKRLLE